MRVRFCETLTVPFCIASFADVCYTKLSINASIFLEHLEIRADILRCIRRVYSIPSNIQRTSLYLNLLHTRFCSMAMGRTEMLPPLDENVVYYRLGNVGNSSLPTGFFNLRNMSVWTTSYVSVVLAVIVSRLRYS
ncbi:hypothetical protein SISSUDRAFT_592677 [Sistotremastrum suecicum HHB10207 ss-3]|uniref:Uncharacterized protein n=1 Tax=Sistotremastrum suecicum HHB10207 ss-3 TaxID=1314776 RepID=A0A165XBT9_9AGAM|nr:hypothetical protein SISSUDRAFT_592677 [Sistotremastrum suecicum HHB10207 ss-3]